MSNRTQQATNASHSYTEAAKIAFRRAEVDEYFQECVALMVRSDPWKTLGIKESVAKTVIEGHDIERYLAMHHSEMIGFVTLQMAGSLRGYVRDIAIHPDWRGRGVGSRLLDSVEERIFRDTKNVFLCVSAFNTRAQKWYYRRGYVTVGILTDYLITGSDEILLRKTCGPLLEA